MDDEELIINDRIRIPTGEFQLSFMRSSGPGGQNVNKVNTKVRLRWKVVESAHLSEDVKRRFLSKYSRRITAEGEFAITSQRYRDQPRNIADCLEKLRELLVDVATPPRPRKKTRPSRASKQRRLAEKKERSGRKQLRKKPKLDD